MAMKNCERFNEIFLKAWNESLKTKAGQELTRDMAMYAFCNGKTSKKEIKKLKDDVIEGAFWSILKESEIVRNIFAKCVYKDLRSEVQV